MMNSASRRGGAIYYDTYRPVLNNVTFTSNSAPHGPDIASYPVKIVKAGTNDTQITLDALTSGIASNETIRLSVVDHDNQISSITTGGRITISKIDPSTSVSGTSSASIVDGIATFNDLVLIAPPGSQNVTYRVSSTMIDSAKIQKQYGSASIQDPLIANFEFCKPGEYESNNQCIECIAGTYSLEWNATVCGQWPENMEWLGGEQLHVDYGYWRSSLNSTVAIECLRESACLGEYAPEKEFPVNCAVGYGGRLCTEWQIVDGEKFERLSGYEWSRCPDPLMNIIRISGLMILVLAFFIVLIVVGIRKRKESQQSILLRILANYLQLLTAALSFDMKFPKALTDMLYPVERVGSSSEAFLSVDCFFRDTEITAFTPSNAMFKIFLTGLLPIFLILVSSIVWFCMYPIRYKVFQDLKRNITVTTVVILFLLHPTLTRVSLEMFQCVKVDENEFRVRIDLEMVCYSAEHVKWCLLLGLPILIVWVIGCPLFVLIILFRNRNRLKESEMQRYFLLLYQGLRKKAFFWEGINTLRKVSMVAVNVFMSTVPLMYSALTAVIILVSLIRLQMALNPYKNDVNNKLEIDAMITGGSTLF